MKQHNRSYYSDEFKRQVLEDYFRSGKTKAAYFRQSLEALPGVKSVSGLGLMLGAELDGMNASDVLKKALDKGLLVLTAKTKLRCLPPLTITYEQIDAGMAILREVLEHE